MKKIYLMAFGILALTSCDDLFTPVKENNLGVGYMYQNPQYAEGVLANAYTIWRVMATLSMRLALMMPSAVSRVMATPIWLLVPGHRAITL